MYVSSIRYCNTLPRIFVCVTGAAFLPALANAAPTSHNPTSKFYVADVEGDAQIDTGEKVDDLNKQSVYNAQGTVVETKANSVNAMVFSNGTGIFFDSDTRVEMKRFEQEPFVPNRTDMDTEPSVSQTQAYLPRGTVGLCTSNLVAGSTMTYRTPLASVNIRGGKVVIQSENGVTTVSMLDGDSTVQAGNVDTGGHPLRGGEQALITAGPAGSPPVIKIQNIPSGQQSQLEGKVTMACTAKKTVYFEVRSRSSNTQTSNSPGLEVGLGANAAAQGTPGESTSSNDSSGTVTAFDGISENTGTTGNTGTSTTTTTQQVIVAVPVVPSTLPVQFEVTPTTS
jgi:hypothetical protein